MTKENLRLAAGLPVATIGKVSKDRNITTEALAQICETIAVNINDVCEVAKESRK